ncbi:MAG: aminoglycoside 6-adenylyltransferase [Dermatophilaceae bacterium]
MDAVGYQRFTGNLVAWAANDPAVIGLIAVGSTADVTHHPDEWSDHDVFVVTTAEAVAGLLEDPSWLPDAERIVMWHAETVDGRAAVYDDGHLIELAVFGTSGIPSLSVNDYRVLVDKSDLTARFANWKRDTTLQVAETDTAGSRRFRQIVVQLIVGLGRDARGESLSAHERIRGQALTHLLSLVRDFVPAENDTPLDNLDPYRRIEMAHPEICRRLNTALTAPLPELADTMLSLLQDHLVDRVPAFSAESLTAVRALAARL